MSKIIFNYGENRFIYNTDNFTANIIYFLFIFKNSFKFKMYKLHILKKYIVKCIYFILSSIYFV